MTRRVRLLIADYGPTRIGICMALANDVEICAEAEDAREAVTAARREQPDVCLVGRQLFGDGLDAVREMCLAAPQAAVVVLAHDHDAKDVVECVHAGAVGYVPGALDSNGLRRIIAAVASGEAVIPRSLVLELLLELRAEGSGVGRLTRREAQVLRMLRRGHSTTAIAERLGVAPVTVRRHISQLVHKLGVDDRSALLSLDAPAGRSVASGQGDRRA